MKQLTLFDLFDEQQNQFCTSETRLEIACKPSKSPEGLLQLGEAAIGNIADVEKQSNLSSGITASNKSASDLNQAPKYEPLPKVEHTPMDYNTPMMRQWKMIKEQYPDTRKKHHLRTEFRLYGRNLSAVGFLLPNQKLFWKVFDLRGRAAAALTGTARSVPHACSDEDVGTFTKSSMRTQRKPPKY